MKIRKGGRVVFDCEIAGTPWKKFKGIMFKRAFKPLFFDFGKDTKAGCALHTFFMLKTIDILFINSEQTIVEIKTTKPWKPLIKPKDQARYVLELPHGMGKKFKAQAKAQIKF